MSFLRKLIGATPKINMADATAQVQDQIQRNSVVVFSKSYCPYCKEAKSLLKKLSANAEVIELDQIKEGSSLQDALQEISGQRTVPNIFISQDHIGGNSELQALHKAGKLEPLLAKASL